MSDPNSLPPPNDVGITQPSQISSGDPNATPEYQALEMRVARLEKLVEYFYATYHRNTDIDEIAR